MCHLKLEPLGGLGAEPVTSILKQLCIELDNMPNRLLTYIQQPPIRIKVGA
jgi:hypothetical protein